MTQQTGASNVYYELSGQGIHLTYRSSDEQGQPELRYQDAELIRIFRGNDLSIEENALGTLVTATLSIIADGNVTTLTVLVPGVNMAGQPEQPIETLAILTTHRNSFIGPPPGANEVYQVYNLQGAARSVATTGVVTLSLDAASYYVGDTITVTLNNQSNQTISFPDHLTSCSVIQLQRQVDGNWQEVNPCRLLILTRIHTLDAGQSLPVELAAATEVAGLYRATMSYSTSANFSEPRTAIYSPEFQVNDSPFSNQ